MSNNQQSTNTVYNTDMTEKLCTTLEDVVNKTLTDKTFMDMPISELLRKLIKNKNIDLLKCSELFEYENCSKEKLLFLTNTFTFLYTIFNCKNLWNLDSELTSGSELDDIDNMVMRKNLFLRLAYFSFYDYVTIYEKQIIPKHVNSGTICIENFMIDNWDNVNILSKLLHGFDETIFSLMIFDFSKIQSKTKELADELINEVVSKNKNISKIGRYYNNLHGNEYSAYQAFMGEL